jgi:hypothetical protein
MEASHEDRMQHLEEGTIHAWLDGALSADEQALVEQHVQQCAECASMVAEARGMIAGAARIVGALDIVPGGVIPKQRTGAPGSGSLWRSLRLTPFRAALAASLMIAAASVITVRQNATRQLDVAEFDSAVSVATPTSARPAPAPAPIASAPVPSAAAAQDLIAATPPATRTANAPAAVERSKVKAAAPSASQPVSGVVADAAPRREPAAAAALNEVVTTSALRTPISADSLGLREARRIAQDSRTDSTRANAAKATAGAAGQVVVADRTRMERATGLIMTSVPSMDVAGCYRVSRDSSAVLAALPERFALERSSATVPARSVIYAIDTAGRLDTTVIGTWRDLNTNSVLVNLTARNAQQPLTLAKTVDGFTVQPARTFAPSQPPRIVRTSCPP